MTPFAPQADESIVAMAAGHAAAGVLPSTGPLAPSTPHAGDEHVTAVFDGAVIAELEGSVPARIAVLVGHDLVAALEESPLGGLDLAAAVQPTLDAVASALACRVDAARQVDLALVVGDLGGPFTVVPLVGDGLSAALLIPDVVLTDLSGLAMDDGVDDGVLDGVDSGLRGAPAHTPDFSYGTQPLTPETFAAEPGAPGVKAPRRGIELLHGVDMEVTVEIGRARMTVRELLDLSPGTVLELDRTAGSPADLLVNGRLIAHGQVVVIDEDFGLRVTEIVVDAAAG